MHNWIDLIFGIKQQKQSIENFNVFCAVTYEKLFKSYIKTHESEIDSVIDQVYHFGQTPINLFTKKSHPIRDEIPKTYTFQKLFYFNEDNDLELKRLQKTDSKPGRIAAVFLLNLSLITIKILNDQIFITKYKFKDANDTLIFHCEFLLQHYKPVHENEKMIETCNLSHIFLEVQPNTNVFAIFQKKYLLSGLDPSNNLIIHTLKGSIFTLLPYHTNIITSVCCTSTHIFSASLDSTIMSWKFISINNTFNEHTSFFGHSSPVLHLQALDSYQLIISSSLEGILLIHDIRTGECLKKINESALCFDVNEHGIIGVCNSGKIRFFEVNGEMISEYDVYNVVNSLKFTQDGDFIIEIYDKFLIIRDFFRPYPEKCVEISGVSDIVLDFSEKSIFVGTNSLASEENYVNLYRLFSKKQLKTQQNLLIELV